MTTPNGAIVFNASTGSDSAASGLGPATAQTGSGASTDGTAVVTGITTTGVSAGDLLWVQTASGRKFSIIASVDSGTQVTCDDTFVLGSGQTWAIGGKRATWDNSDSRRLFTNDAKAGFIIETETDQTLNSPIIYSTEGNNSSGFIHIRGASSVTHPVILQTSNDGHFAGNTNVSTGWSFTNLKFTNSGTTGSGTIAIQFRDGNKYLVTNCIFGDATNTLYAAISVYTGGGGEYVVADCEFQYLVRGPYATLSPAAARDATYTNCISHNNGNFGFNVASGESLINCIAYDNTGPGFLLESISSTDGGSAVANCIAYNNTGDGIQIESIHGATTIKNCILVSNGGYGIEKDTRTADETLTYNYFDNNAFYGNTSGEVSANITTLGPNGHTTLTADPFTDAAAGDFTINETSGGGADLRTTAVTLGSTETRPFRWLDTSTAGGATLASDARIERLK
jgi:hypothetical protein